MANHGNMKVAELKSWLTSRGAPTKGNKAELIARYDILTQIEYSHHARFSHQQALYVYDA